MRFREYVDDYEDTSKKLTYFEKNCVCLAIAKSIEKEENKLRKIKQKIDKCEKTFFTKGEGLERINMLKEGINMSEKTWKRTYKTIQSLINASKKLGCFQKNNEEKKQ